MKISYAQRLEDYHLALVLRGGRFQTYVDVGGGHPVADNVSFHFYLMGWRGLVVEPQTALADKYASIRPRDRVVQTLAGERSGSVTFHRVDRFHGFSTTKPEHAQMAAGYGVDVVEETRNVEPLSTLMDQAGITGIDFLKIDVEGAERDVLLGIDFSRHRPLCLCIEAVAPGSMAAAWDDWEPLLIQSGYEFVFFDGLNRFYCPVEETELKQRFPKEPADWGVATHLYEFGRAGLDAQHPDSDLAKALVRGLFARLPLMQDSEILTLLSSGAPGAAQALLHGSAHYPGAPVADVQKVSLTLDERSRAALGRIAAGFDGGMIFDGE